MATLTIGLRTGLDGLGAQRPAEAGGPTGLVVRVTQVQNRRGVRPKRAHRETIALAVDAGPVALEVPAGFYFAELALPSGQLLAENADLIDDGDGQIRFDLGGSAHEWLGWQMLEGSVPEGSVYRRELARTGTLPRSPRGLVGRQYDATKGRLPASLRRTYYRRYDPGRLWPDVIARPALLAVPRQSLVTLLVPRGAADWRVTGGEQDLALVAWGGRAEALEEGLTPSAFEPGGAELRPLPRPDASDHLFDRWRILPDAGLPRFALAATAQSLELVSLPAPWMVQSAGQLAAIELMIDKSEALRPSRTSLSVLDPGMFALLSYMKAGNLALARESLAAGPVNDMLIERVRMKMANPLAAAAACYCLLGASDLQRRAPWHQWTANLDQWFDWLPDGAIVRGRLAAAKGRDKEARAAFLRAFARGLPYYVLGLTWLLEGLRRYRDEEAQAAAAAVRRVAVRADMSQAFTILSYGPAFEFD